jgi:hypothetical protein
VKPKNNAEVWLKKISGNQARDRLVTKTPRQKASHVVRIWGMSSPEKMSVVFYPVSGGFFQANACVARRHHNELKAGMLPANRFVRF